MDTLSVIEQAKGIVMAQRGCGPEEAFGLLRQVSQRSNVKLHVLAEQIVGQVAASNARNVTPIRLRAARSRRSRRRQRT